MNPELMNPDRRCSSDLHKEHTKIPSPNQLSDALHLLFFNPNVMDPQFCLVRLVYVDRTTKTYTENYNPVVLEATQFLVEEQPSFFLESLI
jgi:hypothetical protein